MANDTRLTPHLNISSLSPEVTAALEGVEQAKLEIAAAKAALADRLTILGQLVDDNNRWAMYWGTDVPTTYLTPAGVPPSQLYRLVQPGPLVSCLHCGAPATLSKDCNGECSRETLRRGWSDCEQCQTARDEELNRAIHVTK
jgi:hypothetical protein